MFKENQKVIINSKNHKFYGRIARILKKEAGYTSSVHYKLEIPGCDTGIWFAPRFLRPVRMLGEMTIPQKNEPVRVVDVKGIYNSMNAVGYTGLVEYADEQHICLAGNKDDTEYVQIGDHKSIPKEKVAWVIRSQRLYKEKVTRVSVGAGTCTWETSDNYIVQDKIVFDSLTKALSTMVEYKSIDGNKIKIKYE